MIKAVVEAGDITAQKRIRQAQYRGYIVTYHDWQGKTAYDTEEWERYLKRAADRLPPYKRKS